MYEEWSPQEDRYLIDNYKRMTNPQIAKELLRTVKSVEKRASKLRLRKSRYAIWTKEELNFLINNFHLSDEELSKAIPNHSIGSIRMTARRYGLYKFVNQDKILKQNVRQPKPNNTKIYTKLVENKIGRPLANGETVHHINMDSYDHDINNLHLFHNRSDHRRAHTSINRLVKGLLEQGHIVFNRDTGIYEFPKVDKSETTGVVN